MKGYRLVLNLLHSYSAFKGTEGQGNTMDRVSSGSNRALKYQNTVKLRVITGVLLVMLFVRCGQGGQTEQPVDRHAHHLILTRHARCRMDCRHITEKEIREILEGGEINYKKSEP